MKFIVSLTATISASAKLLVSIFCFNERDNIAPSPRVITAPMWLCISFCTVNDALINHNMVAALSHPTTSGRYVVPHRYCIAWPSLSRSESFGHCTFVYKYTTTTCRSDRALLEANRSQAVVWWKNSSYFSHSFGDSSSSSNKLFLAGYSDVPAILFGISHT